MDTNSKLSRLLETLVNRWNSWDEYSEYYIELAIKLVANPDASSITWEKKLFREMKRELAPEDLKNLGKYIQQSLSAVRYAEKKRREAVRRREEALKREQERAAKKRRDRERLLKKQRQEAAYRRSLARKHERERAEKERQERARRENEKRGLLKNLKEHLEQDFLNADRFYQDRCTTHISFKEYEAEKINFVQSWANNNCLDRIPDEEQAAAIGAVEGNIQVVARAGSGKTATLINRARFLQQHCGVSPDEMLLLAFNRKAAYEMRDRIASFVQESTPHVMTFHALAFAMVQPEKILLDEPDGEQSQSRVLQGVVDSYLRNPVYYDRIRDLMMKHFRTDWERIVSGGYDRTLNEMLRYRRSLRCETLDGKPVKSYGEKAIANFLFEHSIKYKYEPLFWWGPKKRHPYHPDFTIPRYKVAIEYFGLSGNPGYDKMSEEKRNYWRNKPNWRLLDYSPHDVRRGEDDFCALLKQDLEALGISCVRLSDNQIWHQIKGGAIVDFTEVVRGFIQRCRKLSLTLTELSKKIQDHNCINDVEEHFLNLVQDFYRSYLERFDAYGLQRPEEEDFDGLVQRAVEIIKNGETEFHYKEKIAPHRPRTCNLKHVRYVFIDEYQDFSELFYRLTKAIREKNTHARFFCVGDDWQAINSFAGSDLHFFKNFCQAFQNSRKLHVIRNYRSVGEVVDVGNALMQGRGKSALAHKTVKGKVVIADLDTFPLARILHENYPNLGDYSTHALLCLVRKIIDDGKNVVLLSRINSEPWSINYENWGMLSGKRGLDRFLAVLCSRLSSDHAKKVKISTVHKFKGLQKDAVIVLDANIRRYPLVHPNWFFNRVFGDSERLIIDEERRLFYVALTRAVEELYILTKGGNPSPFLEDLEENMELSKLKWSDYPPPACASKILIRVGNQYGHGSRPTTAVKELLKTEGYDWDDESKTWYILRPADGFSVKDFANQANWSNSANGIYVRFYDDFENEVAVYHVDEGKWTHINGKILRPQTF